MSTPEDPPASVDAVVAEPVEPRDSRRLAHLAQNRGLIVRRALLSTALGGFIPLPVMDDFVAGRVRAGLFIKLAASRNVDLPQSAADLLADPRRRVRRAQRHHDRRHAHRAQARLAQILRPARRRPRRRGDGHHLPVRHPRRSLCGALARGRGR